MDRVRVQVFLGWTLANLLSELIDEFEETDDPILNQIVDIMSSILEQKYQTQKIRIKVSKIRVEIPTSE